MIPNAASREGTPLTPPTGPYRVLVWVGGRVEEVASRPETEEGREAAAKLFKGSQHPAALCRGTTVVKRNGRGEARTAAFKAFAAGAAAPAPIAPPEPVTPRPDEPAAAPVAPTTVKPAEEPMPTTTPASTCPRPDCDEPSANARGCGPAMVPFCRKHRTAAMAMRVQYRLTDEEAAERCIANGSASPPPKVSASKPAASKKAPAAIPAPKPSKTPAKKAAARPQMAPRSAAPAPAPSLADGLARVQRHAAVVASLGGAEAAEQLAALVADAGGVAVVVEALTTLRGLA